MQRQAPRTLAELIEGVAETKLSLKPAPSKWSVAEILAHMAEDEQSSTWRYRAEARQAGGSGRCSLSNADQPGV